MSVADILKLADDKLHEIFTRKPHDPAKARAPIVKGIERTENQFKSATPVKGRKWFKIANGIVEFTPPFSIGGKSTLYVPSERFADVLKSLRKAVEAGELDKEIEAGATTTNKLGIETPKKTRAGWSPERRAAFEARKKKQK